MREFLTRNQVPFTWVDVEEEPGITEVLGDFAVAEEGLAVVASGNWLLMRNPSIGELAEVLGLRRPIRAAVYDLVIVGAGRRGSRLRCTGASEGLSTPVLESEVGSARHPVARLNPLAYKLN